MRYEVLLTQGAEHDLEGIHDYIAKHESLKSADHVLDRLLETAAKLATEPLRGSIPRELRPLGLREYRQVFFKPYQIIYRVIERRVLIHLISDGRRDLQTLLARRFFHP